ncbi:hypothetical protein VTH8203_04496 [Vibrio thalassae]|uniref:Uncharacterized protein n=1 Tax=Vibrio thalassae TaxID=1243014 RepID=A0A240EQ50_9VIBR|nr:hypothetical protein VTH8203_04496 [Vibrio thalassae]
MKKAHYQELREWANKILMVESIMIMHLTV